MSLSSDLRKISTERKSDMEKIVRASSFQLGANVIVMSPVDEGRFRNNWNSSINSIDDSTDRGLQESGTGSIGQLESKVSSVDIGATFNFSNSLPYANRIEYDGHSKQAPDGVVRVAILQWDNIVKHEVSKYK